MHGLGWADTEQDSQDLRVGYSLSQLGIEAGATLLNPSKVKARREGDRIDEVGVIRVIISSGNSRMPPNI